MLIFLCCLVAVSLLFTVGIYIYYHFNTCESERDLRLFVPDYGSIEDACGWGVAKDED